jgi:hypothetical protein
MIIGRICNVSFVLSIALFHNLVLAAVAARFASHLSSPICSAGRG